MNDTTESAIEIKHNRRQHVGVRKPEHFWQRIQKPVGCWLYDGAKEINGYGYLKNPFSDKPRYLTAHRVAWMLTNGPIPDGLRVLHRCDVRACCNPEHLFLGTDADNATDRMTKNRYRGALRPEHVVEIRKLLGTMPQTAIAKKFGVKDGVISKLSAGKTYWHIK